MDKAMFNGLDIKEQVFYVNNELMKKRTFTDISSEVGLARATIRERFDKSGFKMDKDSKQYVRVTPEVTPFEVKSNTTSNTLVTPPKPFENEGLGNSMDLSNTGNTLVTPLNRESNTKSNTLVTPFEEESNTSGNTLVTPFEEEGNTKSNTPSNTKVFFEGKESELNKLIIDAIKEECPELFEMAAEYVRSKEEARNIINLENPNLSGKIVTRSVKTYENVIDEFADFCRSSGMTQKDLLALAMIEFMEKHR